MTINLTAARDGSIPKASDSDGFCISDETENKRMEDPQRSIRWWDTLFILMNHPVTWETDPL